MVNPSSFQTGHVPNPAVVVVKGDSLLATITPSEDNLVIQRNAAGIPVIVFESKSLLV